MVGDTVEYSFVEPADAAAWRAIVRA